MKEYRMLVCQNCGNTWRSNKNSINPRCTKCDSKMWLDQRDLSDQVKIEKMKDDVYSKLSRIDTLDKYVDTLIAINNRLVDEYKILIEQVSLLETRSTTSNPAQPKVIKSPNMADAINLI